MLCDIMYYKYQSNPIGNNGIDEKSKLIKAYREKPPWVEEVLSRY